MASVVLRSLYLHHPGRPGRYRPGEVFDDQALDPGRGEVDQPLSGLIEVGGLRADRQRGRRPGQQRFQPYPALRERQGEQFAVGVVEQVEADHGDRMGGGFAGEAVPGGDPAVQGGERGAPGRGVPADQLAVEHGAGRQLTEVGEQVREVRAERFEGARVQAHTVGADERQGPTC
jgi:hypothetical protein